MIVDAKLGAEKIIGIDNDETALNIAEKNLLLNHIKKSRLNLIKGNLADRINHTYDLVVANILAEIIIILFDDIKKIEGKKMGIIEITEKVS